MSTDETSSAPADLAEPRTKQPRRLMRSVLSFWHLLNTVPRKRLLLLIVLMMLVAATEGFGLLMLVPILESVITSNSAMPEQRQGLLAVFDNVGWRPALGSLLLVFVALVALQGGVRVWRERLAVALQQRLVDELRLKCFSAVFAMEWRALADTNRAEHANILLSEVNRVGVGLHLGLALVASVVTVAAYLTAALLLSWSMTLLALASGAIIFGLLSGQRRNALQLGQRLSRANRDLHGNVQEGLAGIKLAKILGTEPQHLDRLRETTARLRAQQMQFVNSTSMSKAWFQLGGASLLAAYVYVGFEVWDIAVPVLLTLVFVFARLVPLLMNAHQQTYQWLHALPALESTERLLADCHRDAEPRPRVNAVAPTLERAITLKGVTVTYRRRREAALDDLSITFPARSTTAIVGASGAGKSTMADLLMGLLEPDSGECLVDDVVLRGPVRHAWRRQVAYVPQDVFLFNDTIRNNMLRGFPDASEKALQLALERAAAEFVLELPRGLETVVGDGGQRLSGGERQRIALARALLRQPSLLMLDEATSALDTDNEARIRRAIERLHGDLTVVVIGHRLPTLEHADQVIVLDAGRITAQGRWDEVR